MKMASGEAREKVIATAQKRLQQEIGNTTDCSVTPVNVAFRQPSSSLQWTFKLCTYLMLAPLSTTDAPNAYAASPL